MQVLSSRIAEQLRHHDEIQVLRLSRGNAWLPIYAIASTFRLALGLLIGNVRVLLLGDPALSWLGLMAKAFGRPVAVVIHGLDVTFPQPLYQSYLRWCFWRRFDAYICISRHVVGLVEQNGITPDKIHLIFPGLDSPPKLKAPEINRPMLLLLGRLTARKGALWFVSNVFPELIKHHPNLRLSIAGDGPQRAAIQLEVARLGLCERITIHGSVDENTKHSLMASSIALIMPNLPTNSDPEGFGLVAVEAAAAGRYVFAANLEGLRDAVFSPATGLLLAPGDTRVWIDSLSMALDAPNELVALGENARSHLAGCNRSWEAMGRRYHEVLNAIG